MSDLALHRDPILDLAERAKSAQTVAALAVKSGLYKGSPESLAILILLGVELGLTPLQALRMIYVVEGRPTMSADGLVALCKSRPAVCAYFRLVETSAERATYETLRHGEPSPSSLTYTIEDAQRAGLAGKGPWRAHPAAMLRARCAAALARAVYPDLVAGIYEPGEVQEIAAREASEKRERREPTPAPVSPGREVEPPAEAEYEENPPVVEISPEEFGKMRGAIALARDMDEWQEIAEVIASRKERISPRDLSTLRADLKARREELKAAAAGITAGVALSEPAPAPAVVRAEAAPASRKDWPRWAETVAPFAVRSCPGDPAAAEIVAGIVEGMDRAGTADALAKELADLRASLPEGYAKAIDALGKARADWLNEPAF